MRLLRRHARFGGRGPKPKLTALRHLFRQTNSWLLTLGVDYWIEFGTLLGWHREANILSHDSDIDFGLPIEAYPVLCSAVDRLPRGITLHDSSQHHHGPKLYLQSEGWEADFYFHQECDENLCSTLRSDLPGDTLPFPRTDVYPLQQTEFLGAKTWVPHHPLRLLEHHFGYTGPDAILDRTTGYYRPRADVKR